MKSDIAIPMKGRFSPTLAKLSYDSFSLSPSFKTAAAQATFLSALSVVRDSRLPVYRPEGLPAVHAVAQRGEFMINEQLIDPLKPLGRRFDGTSSDRHPSK